MPTLTSLASALTLGLLAHALPASHPRQETCNALVETSPWHITEIKVNNASPSSATGSWLWFHIVDTNPGLEFDTFCGISMPAGTDQTPEQSGGWHACDDERVRFLYQPWNLQIRRTYKDDCLGSAPWNGGSFLGNADTNYQVTKSEEGEVWTQTGLEMPITSQTA